MFRIVVPAVAIVLVHAASLGNVYYDMHCMKDACGKQLTQCREESAFLVVEDMSMADPMNTHAAAPDLKKFSACDTVLQCILKEESSSSMAQSGEGSPNSVSVCTDGIRDTMSEKEKNFHQCAMDNQCVRQVEAPQGIASLAESTRTLKFTSISPSCLRDSCVDEFVACGDDAECKAVAECLELHLGDKSPEAGFACTKHLMKLDASENSLIKCARTHKCITEHDGPISLLQTDQMPGPPSSLLEVSSESDSMASMDVKRAEANWEAARKSTDSLLEKVHSEMKALNKDLDETAAEQKKDMQLLKDAREKENKELEATQKKLKSLSSASVKTPVSSFISTSDDNLFAPLRKAAEEAKNFAAEVRKEAEQFKHMKNMPTSSFLQSLRRARPESLVQKSDHGIDGMFAENNELSSKTDKSLALAQEALDKLKSDIKDQQEDLKKEEDKLTQSEEKTKGDLEPSSGISDFPAASFIQTESTVSEDPLSPQALQEWKMKFDEELKKIREAAKLDPGTSFLQTDSSGIDGFGPVTADYSDESIKRGEREVERMQQQFQEGLNKLKEENAQLLAESKAELEKDREMKDQLESEKARRDAEESSFLQRGGGHAFDAEKEEENIKNLSRKWQKEAAKIAEGGAAKLAEFDSEQQTMLEQAKEKEEAQQEELRAIRDKLNQDIEKLHKDVAVVTARQHTHTGPSFLQMMDVSVGDNLDAAQPAPELHDSKNQKVEVDPMEKAQQVLRKLSQALDNERAKTQAEAASIGVDPETGNVTETIGAKTPVSTSGSPGSLSPSSFIENPESVADAALAKAEADLRNLQEQLSRPPEAVFGEARDRVKKYMDQAENAASQPLPEELRTALRGGEPDTSVLVPPPVSGNIDNLMG